jgi:hypothetical protein
MNGISQNGEAWGGQNDPPTMPSRGFEPGSVNFDKKVMEKVKFRLNALPTELCSQVTEGSNISL